MRAARGIVRLPCALLAGIALTGAGIAHPPLPPGTGNLPASGAGSVSAATVSKPLPPQDLLFACPTTRDYAGRVVAAVMVDGKGPFRFIIDTGANESTVSPKLASILGLAPSTSEPIRVAGITGTAVMPSIPIESLRAGALVIAHAHFPVLSSPIMIGADGILGAAGLTDDSLFVDFRHNSVVIRRADEAPVPVGYAKVRAQRLPGGLLSVPGEVGDVPVEAIIDTGSPQTLGNMALYRALYSKPRGTAVARVYGATQQVRTGKVQVAPAVDLGAIRVGNAVLVFGDLPIFKVWGLTRQPAIILGMDVLGTVNAFSIDFRHAEIGIDPRVTRPTDCSIGYRARQPGC